MHSELNSRSVASKAPRKNENLFWGGNIHFRKNAYLSRKFQAIFVRKKFVSRFPHGLNYPCLFTSASAAMVFESRNVFIKRVPGEKHMSGVMCENLGGATPLAPLC